jgi:hypothetical protein
MEAEKERVGSRVPTGLHAHLYMGEKSSDSRAGPVTGLAGWALGMGRTPSTNPTPAETESLIDGARTRPGLSGPRCSTSPRSPTVRSASRSGNTGGGTPRAIGEEEAAGTSKDQDPTWSLNGVGSDESLPKAPTLAPGSGGKSDEPKEGEARHNSGDLDLALKELR